MAFNVFNYKNQSLNAEKLREMSYFTTSNFGGIVEEESPIYIDGNKVSFVPGTNTVKFLAGGLYIECTEQLDYEFKDSKNLLCLEVTLNSDNSNLMTDTMVDNYGNSYVKFSAYEVKPMNVSQPFYTLAMVEEPSGNPAAKGYYYYDEETKRFCPVETDELENIPYYHKLESTACSFGLSGINYTYKGNTIWLSDTKFIVPLVVRSNSGLVSEVVSVKSKENFEDLLSIGSYAELKAMIENEFVWHEGGKELVGEKQKGDIADLNITGNYISHVNNTEDNFTDRVRLSNIQVEALANDANCWNSKLIVNKDGSIDVDPDYKTPVEAGGTFSDTNWDEKNPRRSAKQNLGIFYGTSNPPATGNKEGDIYFKIIGHHDISNDPTPPDGHNNVIFHPGYNYWGQPIYTVADIFHPVVLSVSEGGTSYIDVDPVVRPLSHSFKKGLVATVVAVPNPGWTFSYWRDSNGHKVSTSRVYSFKVTANRTLMPVFKQIIKTYDIWVDSTRGGNSYIRHGGPIFPMHRTFVKNDTCTIVAIPDPGHWFRYWRDDRGNIVSYSSIHSFTVNKDRRLTAVFSY